MTTEELLSALARDYRLISDDTTFMKALASFIRRNQRKGRHLCVGDGSLWKRGFPVIEVPLINARFLLASHELPQTTTFRRKVRFVLCTGDLHEDRWRDLRGGLTRTQAFDLMSASFGQARF